MSGEKRDLRDVMVERLINSVERGMDVMVLLSDSSSTSKIQPFLQKFPERVINVGIAEQNLIGIAAGISLGGQIAVTANAAPFLLNRSNEQVKNDICYSRTNVKLVGLNPGVGYGSLGPTHHSIDDISIMRGFGEILILAPSDPLETDQVFNFALGYDGPVYIRLDSSSLPGIHDKTYQFSIGKPVILAEGSDISIIALGSAAHDALEAAENLKKASVSAEVISITSIRPLDKSLLADSIRKTRLVVSVEEHSTHGGVGSLIADLIAEQGLSARLIKLGIPEGSFADASPRDHIKKITKIDALGIEETCIKNVKRI